MPTNLNKWKQHCKEECSKIPPQCRVNDERLIKYRKPLLKVVLHTTESWGGLSFSQDFIESCENFIFTWQYVISFSLLFVCGSLSCHSYSHSFFPAKQSSKRRWHVNLHLTIGHGIHCSLYGHWINARLYFLLFIYLKVTTLFDIFPNRCAAFRVRSSSLIHWTGFLSISFRIWLYKGVRCLNIDGGA